MELERLEHLTQPDEFIEFTGDGNRRIDDYFGAMENGDLRKKEFAAASRKYRNEHRKKYVGSKQEEYKQKMRQEQEEEKERASLHYKATRLNNAKLKILHEKEVAKKKNRGLRSPDLCTCKAPAH
jgi:hypothetical protein